MLGSAAGRRRLGLIGWLLLAGVTVTWLVGAHASLSWWAWPVILVPFAALLPGMLRPARNAWLLALLATIGYATVGFMDAIANPNASLQAPVLAAASLITFFMIIPAVRTMPAPPKDPNEI